jgi:hypothetical protein
MTRNKKKIEQVENSGQALIDVLSGEEKSIVKRLRALVLECLPKAVEKNYYGLSVPFYKHNRMICFIWPPSMSWGKKKYTLEEHGVTLGFCQGNLMSNEEGVLLKENRKQVYCMYFKSLKEIDDQLIRSLLYEAEMIDDSFSKKKKTSKGRTR